MNASRVYDSVLLNVPEGKGKLAKKNRQTGTFRPEKGTLHKPSAEFDFNWIIDEKFGTDITASDPVVVHRLINERSGPSEEDRGVPLHLIDLKDHQIARNSIRLGTCGMNKIFDRLHQFGIRSEPTLRSPFCSAEKSVEFRLFFIENARKWLDRARCYSQENIIEIDFRINEVTSFMKLAKGLKTFG